MVSPIDSISEGWLTRRQGDGRLTCRAGPFNMPPEVDERTVVGDVLDHRRPTIWPSSSLLDDFRNAVSARDSSRIARRETTILPTALVHLEDWRRGCSTFISGPMSRIGRMSTCEARQEGNGNLRGRR